VPVYQYACADCSGELEVRQSFTDDSLTTCPTCEGRLRKILSAVGVVFKGSGFYRNDSRAKSTDSDSDTSKSDAKSEAKDAAKSDPKETSSSSKPSDPKESSDGGKKSSDGGKQQTSADKRNTRKDSPSSDKGRVAG
jgi:putative FmdB family regulatory protein